MNKLRYIAALMAFIAIGMVTCQATFAANSLAQIVPSVFICNWTQNSAQSQFLTAGAVPLQISFDAFSDFSSFGAFNYAAAGWSYEPGSSKHGTPANSLAFQFTPQGSSNTTFGVVPQSLGSTFAFYIGGFFFDNTGAEGFVFLTPTTQKAKNSGMVTVRVNNIQQQLFNAGANSNKGNTIDYLFARVGPPGQPITAPFFTLFNPSTGFGQITNIAVNTAGGQKVLSPAFWGTINDNEEGLNDCI